MVIVMALRMEAPINLMATVDVDVDDVVVVAVDAVHTWLLNGRLLEIAACIQ